MNDVNIELKTGRLVKDAELRFIPSGAAVVSFRICVNKSWKGKDGEWKEHPLFLDVVYWPRPHENPDQMMPYMAKGQGVFLEGELEQDEWTDKGGQKRTSYRLKADRVQFIQSHANEAHAGDGPAPEREERQPTARQQTIRPSAMVDDDFGTSNDDSLPF